MTDLPPPSPATIRRLPADQASDARDTLGVAFRDDPLLQLVAPDAKKRHELSTWFMGCAAAFGLRWGEVWANDDASAVAVWLPPGGSVGLGRMLRVGIARLPLKAGLRGTARFFGAMAASETFHKTVHGPHWYLVSLGTRPERQGQGLGSQLVEVGIARADEAGVPCYLETATQENIDFYSKRGFEIIGQAAVGGITITGMVRPPRGTRASQD